MSADLVAPDSDGAAPGFDAVRVGMLDGLTTFVGLTTLGGVLVEANSAPLEAAGLSPADVLGQPFWDTYWRNHSPADQARIRDAVLRAAAGETVRFEIAPRMASGACKSDAPRCRTYAIHARAPVDVST